MINLIPPQAKRAVQREYWIRVLGAWALLLSLVAVVGIVLLVPTYVLLVKQLDVLAQDATERDENGGDAAYESAREALMSAHTLAKQLDTAMPVYPAAVVLDEIQAVQPSGITLTSFTYTYAEADGLRVTASGSADTRTTLIQFSDALERSPLFGGAEVPVSDLARDRNLPFTVTIAVNRTDT